MFKKILATIGTRYMIALLNFVLIFVNAKVLGIDGFGTAGLIVVSANMVVVFNSVLCGSGIVYFLNRYPFLSVFVPAYCWAAVGSWAACAVMNWAGWIPQGHFWSICLLSLLLSLVAANTRFLLGYDRISCFNLIYSLQGGLPFFFVMTLYYAAGLRDVQAYVYALYLANGIAFAVSLWLLRPYFKRVRLPQIFRFVNEMFLYGLWGSADNLSENFTQRLNYFFVEHFCGRGCVGLLDGGTKIAESVWHIARSVAFIEYSSIAKTTDATQQKQVTLQLFKLTFLATLLLIGCIVCIPEFVYTRYLFNEEFAGIHMVIVWLSPGVLALACNFIIGHYFIGSGKIRYSTFSSLAGLGTLLVAGYFLIPLYGVRGSAMTTSMAYTVSLVFSLLVFSRQTATRWEEYMPSRSDWRLLKNKISTFAHKSPKDTSKTGR